MIQAQSTAQKPQPALVQLAERLANLSQAFNKHNARLDSFLDRAHGTSPEAQSKEGQPRAVPNGALAVISQQIDDLYSICGLQESMLERLDHLV